MRDWIPSPDDIGAVLRARTVDSLGRRLGTFTDDTDPTRDDVAPLIDAVVERIQSKCGDIPDDKQALARRVASYGVACDVELAYFPNEVESGRSPYKLMEEKFEMLLGELVLACQSDDGDDSTGDDGPLPIFTFQTCPGLVGPQTVWP